MVVTIKKFKETNPIKKLFEDKNHINYEKWLKIYVTFFLPEKIYVTSSPLDCYFQNKNYQSHP